MSFNTTCSKCSKTAYPTEKIEASHQVFHKTCFRCSESGCVLTLNLKNFEIVNGLLFCNKHAPKPKATAVTDSISVLHAINAPHKSSEGLHKTSKGTGECFQYGLESVALLHALQAPRKPTENLGYIQKGDMSSNETLEGAAKAR